MEIEEIINQVYPLPEASLQKLLENIEIVKRSKGYVLLRVDKIESDIYFIRRGMVRAYSYHHENEITFWFGKEGDTVISMRSYVLNQKGYENIELLEDGELYKLNNKNLQYLFDTDLHIANWGRRFAETELLKTEERLLLRQFKSASERYSTLISEYPELLQRVQLGYIASYLGITQVSLSRIRKEVK